MHDRAYRGQGSGKGGLARVSEERVAAEFALGRPVAGLLVRLLSDQAEGTHTKTDKGEVDEAENGSLLNGSCHGGHTPRLR